MPTKSVIIVEQTNLDQILQSEKYVGVKKISN